MKIRSEVLEVINIPATRSRIAAEMGLGEQTIYRQLKENENNGPLTKMNALQAISKVSGVEVLEILEGMDVEEPQN